jgi:Ser-tRNA(Ala) deacylase AlaX
MMGHGSDSGVEVITEALYLGDTYLTEARARVLDVNMVEGVVDVILDRTIFYPRGGGQPCDQGTIEAENGVFLVDHVRSEQGVVHHSGSWESGRFEASASVSLRLNSGRRFLNSRLHTAGELLCGAMRMLGHESWHVVGAIHYPERSSVEYGAVLPEAEPDQLRRELEALMNRCIDEGHPVTIQTTVDREEVRRLCGFVPDYVPSGEPVRVVTVLGDVGRPCQGTHLRDIREIGPISIRKVKSKKGRTTISYELR